MRQPPGRMPHTQVDLQVAQPQCLCVSRVENGAKIATGAVEGPGGGAMQCSGKSEKWGANIVMALPVQPEDARGPSASHKMHGPFQADTHHIVHGASAAAQTHYHIGDKGA